MTCAPRGIFSTKSASVGRTAVYARRLAWLGRVTPSSRPMSSSWGDDAGVGVELAAVGEA